MEGGRARLPGCDPGRQSHSVCWGLTGLSSPPPFGFNWMIEEMKVLVTEPGYWDSSLLEIWESPEPARRETRESFEAEAKRNENS